MEQVYFLNECDLQGLLRQAVAAALAEMKGNEPPKEEKQEDKLYTTKEACELLRCSKPTLHRWKKDGIISFVRIGRNIRYKETDIENLLNSKKR